MSSKITRIEGKIAYEDGATAVFVVSHTGPTGMFWRQDAGFGQEVAGRAVDVLDALGQAVAEQRDEAEAEQEADA